MTVLDRLLLLAVTAGLGALVWRVEQLRGEVTDKRIDDAALALHAWGVTDGRAALASAVHNDYRGDDVGMRDLADTLRQVRRHGGGG